ncbi:Flp pilus assembly protein CpaB [Limibaculum sp. FT325]|uniref:Flp pilus assembly protein CpaB n=1 Tax=Thermohalobaculum sediminis TaxID=2939436 RepID=UPI0020BEEDB8|nr:Flp pilus assembly protein CpaB [Limibaculum sediminis]MCL5777114.1 Flp pilus assembly protein CpaB [Limibaculum sediminis]
MRLIGILVLVLGVALAGGALFYSKQYFAQIEARNRAPQGPAMVKVVVAKSALAYGAELEAGALKVVDWPKASVPAGTFDKVESLVDAAGREKRYVLRAMEPGEPVLQAKVTGFGQEMGMAMRLGEGKRAYSLPIDAVSGVAGFLAPGDRVDIILTESRGEQLASRVILQDILVIAVDQRSSKESASPRLGRTATVEVDSRQAQILALAQQVGRLSLTLRGFNEEGVAEEPGSSQPVSLDDLIGREQAPAPVDTGTDIRVRKGIAVETTRIE